MSNIKVMRVEANPTMFFSKDGIYSVATAFSATEGKPKKLPSLKTAAANYKKAKKSADKARKTKDRLRIEARQAELADEKAVDAEMEARKILLQVAGG